MGNQQRGIGDPSDKRRWTRRDFLVASAVAAVAAACSDNGSDGDSASSTTTGSPPPETTTSTSTTTTTTAPTTTTSIPVPELGGDPFTLGIASGDPLPDAVIIWTRLAVDPMVGDGGMPAEDVPVTWEVAADETFDDIVASDVARAEPGHGHSVHVDVTGLDPATDYWYRFSVGEHASAAGHMRTAPAAGAATDQLRFAVTTCQAYQSGFYAAWRHVAESDVDAVLFTGDYIYELEGSLEARQHGLAPPTTLEEYRVLYSVNRSDENLQAAHAAHAWIPTWDDHEVEDNYGALTPGAIGRQLNPDADAEFPARRAAAYQAYWEHMPLRTDPPDAEGNLDLYRAFSFGDLVTTAVLDNRQYRDPIPEDAGDGALPRPFGGGPQIEAAFDESRSMLGFEQEEWLAGVLTGSTTTWNLLVQQTLMAENDRRPDLEDAGYSADSWDGYVANRDRLLGLVADEPIENFVALGGDIHAGAVADLKPDYKDEASPVIGAEFVTPSISAIELSQPEAVEGTRSNPHIHHYEPSRRGWLALTVTPEQLRAEFNYLVDALDPRSAVERGPVWVVDAGDPKAREA